MLNILSFETKKNIKYNFHFDYIKRLIIFSYCLIILIVIFQTIIYLYLNQINHDIITNNISSQQINTQNNVSEITTFNSNLLIIQTIQANHKNVPQILNYLSATMISDIELEKINYTSADNSILISGTAKNRDALINFQNNLKNNTHFKNFTFPISNLSEKENIYFNFSGLINYDI